VSNPLVAERKDTTTPLAGTFLLEDGESLVEAIESKSWVAGGLAVVSGVFDVAAMVSDPIGTLIGMGLGWLIDHVQPFTSWLEQLAGDADQVRAHAATWKNVQKQMADMAEQMSSYVNADLSDMSGQTMDAYRGAAGDVAKAIAGAGSWAGAMGTALDVMAFIVQVVHDMVRDAISQVLGSIIAYAGELLCTAGLALPVVLEQIATRVASMITRVGTNMKNLITSARNLVAKLRDLKGLFNSLKGKLDDLFKGAREVAQNISDGVRQTVDDFGRALGGQPAYAGVGAGGGSHGLGGANPSIHEPRRGSSGGGNLPEHEPRLESGTDPGKTHADGEVRGTSSSSAPESKIPQEKIDTGKSAEGTAKPTDTDIPIKEPKPGNTETPRETPSPTNQPGDSTTPTTNHAGQTPDPQRPGYDTEGKPLLEDRSDGKKHYANDPEGTFRSDKNDRLYNNQGGLASGDPYAHGPNREVDHPMQGLEKQENHVPENAETKNMWDNTQHEWSEARNRKEGAVSNAKQQANEQLGIEIDKRSGKDVQQDVDELVLDQATPPELVAKAEDISSQLRDARHGDAFAEQVRAGEWAGHRAGDVVSMDQGRTTLFGEASPTLDQYVRTGPNEIDRLAINSNQDQLIPTECKGGDKPGTSHREIADGTYAQQGSAPYLTDLLTGKNADPRIQMALDDLRAAGTHDKFFENLRNGNVEIVYERVNGRTNGDIQVHHYDLSDPSRPDLGDKLYLGIDENGELFTTRGRK